MLRQSLLVVAMMVMSFYSVAQAQVSPDAFVGQYELIEAREGVCEKSLDVFVSESSWGGVDLSFGSFRIADINSGPKVVEDELVTLRTNAYTTANFEVVEHSELLTKPSRTKSVRHTIIKLQGEKLHLKSQTRTVSKTDSPFDFGTNCVYRRTTVQD